MYDEQVKHVMKNVKQILSVHTVFTSLRERYLGTDAVILRPATAFGVSNRLRQDLLVNDFTYKAIAEKKLVYLRNISNVHSKYQ